MERVGIRAVIRGFIRPLPTVIFLLLLLTAVILLASAAQYNSEIADYFSHLFVINILGVLLLLVLIAANIYRLIKEVKLRQLGSRLTISFLLTFGVLALVPLAIVYAFSIQFLNQSIDSWYDVEIEKALGDALLVGRNSMEAAKTDLIANLSDDIASLAQIESESDVFSTLDEIRAANDLTEISLFTATGRILASSNSDVTVIIPDSPDERMMTAVRRGEIQSRVEPLNDNSLQLRIIFPAPSSGVDQPARFLQVLYDLPFRFANVGESLEQASSQYNRLVYLRRPLKLSFITTLTLVTLLTGLAALWAAILSSRRLIAPLRDLAEGTQAVASGDYSKELPVTSSDELGVLVQSFNDMTGQIKRTQEQEQHTQNQLEDQRAYLETILRRLSSGVLSFDLNHHLRTSNETAQNILDIELESSNNSIEELKLKFNWLVPFFEYIQQNMRAGAYEWQSEIEVVGSKGRQVLNVRGTRLPYENLARGGFVIVFDDMTNLIQAQRSAAWGEVARRLAHEIKNPLTPIQLSAERVRNKFMNKVEGKDKETLDRATRTIANQVESMKQMVNEFSVYAQPAMVQLQTLDLNQLIRDVVEMYMDSKKTVRFELELQEQMPFIRADASRLRQVLNNLIINAHDALLNTKDAVISIRTCVKSIKDAEFIELSIVDNGRGFDETMLDRIFEPYVTSKEKGTGLGLAIVKRIVDEHNGVIRVENTAHSGAGIFIDLPIELDQSIATRAYG